MTEPRRVTQVYRLSCRIKGLEEDLEKRNTEYDRLLEELGPLVIENKHLKEKNQALQAENQRLSNVVLFWKFRTSPSRGLSGTGKLV